MSAEMARLRRIRLIGTTAAVAMAIGALGAGALPVLQNPIAGERLFGLWLRLQQSSMTVVMAGMVTVTLCWLLLAPYVLGRDRRGRNPSRRPSPATSRCATPPTRYGAYSAPWGWSSSRPRSKG